MKYYISLLLVIGLICGYSNAIAQQHSFSNYRVPRYKGHPAKLRLKGNALAEMFRTIIRDTYYSKEYMNIWHGATGLNFAGHYCFVYWGCGSPCQSSAVVDLKTGIVYPGVDASLGYDFERNSRLVIVNPGKTIEDCVYCRSEYWQWNDAEKKFIQVP
jgi:hypothetical protein